MNPIRCHDGEIPPQHGHEPRWLTNTHAERHGSLRCSWCASLTVEDAIAALKLPGTHFSGADWKGGPHKFYIEARNPEPDKLYVVGSAHFGSNNDPAARAGYVDVEAATPEQMEVIRRDSEYGLANGTRYFKLGTRSMLYGKFYTAHLRDADEKAFTQWCEVAAPCFDILWNRDPDGRVSYRAPRRGHQQWGTVSEAGIPVVEDGGGA